MVDGVPFPQAFDALLDATIDDEPTYGTRGISPFVANDVRVYSPDIITLMIGTNDIDKLIDVASAFGRLSRLLDKIYAASPNVLVILAQLVPTRTDTTNVNIQLYNSDMRAVVSSKIRQGRHIVLVDMYGAFTVDADYKTTLLGDDLYPNDAGYVRMGQTWYTALAGYLR